MSSKKIDMKFRVDEEVREKLLQEARVDGRRPSSMLDKALRERYKLPWGEQREEINAKSGR